MKLPDIHSFLLHQIPKHPKDIIAVTCRKFGVARPTAHYHLNDLLAEGLVVAEGITRNRVYRLSSEALNWVFQTKPDGTWDENDAFQKCKAKLLGKAPENLRELVGYGVTEMINNTLDHAKATRVRIGNVPDDKMLKLRVDDDGIGIFKKLCDECGWHDLREAVMHLSKGKLTTDPSRHSGEGIFFTARAFDFFSLEANSLLFARQGGEWFLDESPRRKGTLVKMEIAKNSRRLLADVFKEYAGNDEFSFSKTSVTVRLAKFPGELFLSRSQARRILTGLDKFKTVILDFTGVTGVGQGFCDEIFRVFHATHPNIQITPVNMHANVEFMIRHVGTEI